MNELDALDPDVELITFSTGFEVELVRMQTRQFFRLLKVITHGAGPRLIESGLDFSAETTVFLQRLLAITLLSIPDAENEAIDFIRSVLQPAHLVGGLYGKQPGQMSKQETENDQALWDQFRIETFNPNPIDTIAVVETLIRREAEDLQALGKKLTAVLKVFEKTGQLADTTPEAAPEGQELHSSDLSPASSISSAPSTAGATSSSSPSPSAGSGRPLKRRAVAAASSSSPS